MAFSVVVPCSVSSRRTVGKFRFSDGFLDEGSNVAEWLTSDEDSTRMISVFGCGLSALPRDGIPNSVCVVEDSLISYTYFMLISTVLTSLGIRRMLLYLSSDDSTTSLFVGRSSW